MNSYWEVCALTQKNQWNHKIIENLPKSTKPPILAFKVTEFGTNREPVYDFLLVINNNLSHISHRY